MRRLVLAVLASCGGIAVVDGDLEEVSASTAGGGVPGSGANGTASAASVTSVATGPIEGCQSCAEAFVDVLASPGLIALTCPAALQHPGDMCVSDIDPSVGYYRDFRDCACREACAHACCMGAAECGGVGVPSSDLSACEACVLSQCSTKMQNCANDT